VRRVQRLAAYALLHPAPGGEEVLLVQASAHSDLVGRWFLPGGGVDHGEHPADTVVREVAEETGLQVRVDGLLDVLTDVTDLPHRGVQVHTVRCVYDVTPTGGSLRPEAGGSSEALTVTSPARAGALPLAPYVAAALGLPEVPLGPLAPDLSALQPLSGVAGAGVAGGARVSGVSGVSGVAGVAEPDVPAAEVVPRLRVGVYGLALRPAGGAEELLLTRLADHVGGSARWTLPGGGLDHGETVRDGLARELHEETGLDVIQAHLLGISSTHFTGRAPSGTLEDFHGVRVVHAVEVGPETPRVVEVDGSTAEARWVGSDELATMALGSLVGEALALAGHPLARRIGR